MVAELPSPKTTLVILLGASSWPFSPEFQASKAFFNSALEVRDYFLNPTQFGLPPENLLNLFDSQQSTDDIDGEIGHFLERRMLEMKQAGGAARDLVVYFIGHGGFVGNDSDYYLAICRTRTDNPSVSGIRMVSLAYTLKEKARYLRRIVILDCCFAGAAFGAFQSGPAQTAIIQAIDAFKVQGKGMGVPERGTSLLCSSGHKAPSLISHDGTHTIFSQALLQALSTGNPRQQNGLSLRDIANLTEDALHALPEKSTPRPEVHSPDQVDGNVAEVPLFPNLAVRTSRAFQNVASSSITQKPPQANPLPGPALPAPAVSPLPPIHTTFHQGLSTGKKVFLIVIALLVIAGGVGLFNVIRTNQLATETAATETAATATIVARNPDPYPPNNGQLVLDAPLGQPDSFSCPFTNGAYQLSLPKPFTLDYCTANGTDFINFAYEVQMKIMKGDCGGILFRFGPSIVQYYEFYVCQDGTYALILLSPHTTDFGKVLTSTSYSSAIHTKLSQLNVLAVVAIGSTLDLYVNNQKIDSVHDNGLSHGNVGLFAEALHGPTVVTFINAKVWTL